MSKKSHRVWEVTRRAVLGMRLIGRSLQAMIKLTGVLNMPSPMSQSTYFSHARGLHSAAKNIAQTSMNTAADEARKEAGDGVGDIAASCLCIAHQATASHGMKFSRQVKTVGASGRNNRQEEEVNMSITTFSQRLSGRKSSPYTFA